jgi:metallo-beta-lactamase class B
VKRVFLYGLAATVAASVAFAGVIAQAAAVKRDFDKEAEAALRTAKDAAGFEWLGTLNRLCVLPPSNGAPVESDVAPNYVTDPKTAPARDTWFAEPVKIADDFYWLGGKVHSAWVLGDATNGYALFDSQFVYNSDELVLQGLKKLGIDVTKIKYHFTSHDHSDHIGAVAMISKAAPQSIAVFGKADYEDLIAHPKRNTGAIPDPMRVQTVDKTTDFKVGNRTITVVPTPGHTPGTLSYLFTITDRGKPLNVAYSGGTAFNFQTDKADPGIKNLQQYIASNQMFADLAVKFHAAMLISNHSEFDMADKKAKMVAGRGPNDPNPFALGEDYTARYFQVSVNCSKYKIIQLEKAAQGAI